MKPVTWSSSYSPQLKQMGEEAQKEGVALAYHLHQRTLHLLLPAEHLLETQEGKELD